MTDQIREYYRSAVLRVPNASGWRAYVLRLRNGSFLPIPHQVYTPEDLREWLVRLAPLDCYTSAFTSLTPQEAWRRGKDAPDKLMTVDYTFDSDYTLLPWARKNTLKILDWAKKSDHEVRRIIFSGGRGFQVTLTEPQRGDFRDHWQEQREAIIRQFDARGIKLDKPTFRNLFNVFRVEGTLHRNGNVVTGFTPEEIASDHWHMKVVHMVDMPKLPAERKAAPKAPGPTNYILSSITGTKGRQVICLRYSRRETAAKDADELDKAGHDVFMLKGRYFWLVAPGSYEKEQAMKITRGSRADPEFLDLVNRLSYSMVEEDAKPLYLTEKHRNKGRPTSKAHMTWLGRQGGTVGSMELVRRKV